MDKRKLAKIIEDDEIPEMQGVAQRLGGIRHIATAQLVENNSILLINLYSTKKLIKGEPSLEFRLFLGKDDYITQDMRRPGTKWLTSAIDNLHTVGVTFSHVDYNSKTKEWEHESRIYIWDDEDLEIITDFYKDYQDESSGCSYYSYPEPWGAISRFQSTVKARRLRERHKNELAPVDALMDTVGDVPEEFFKWGWETGFSDARFGIYKEVRPGVAMYECTHCKNVGEVSRKEVYMRNNEKGSCPFCGSPVTFKATGRMATSERFERWMLYVDPRPEGFMLRYFHCARKLCGGEITTLSTLGRITESKIEMARILYTVEGGKLKGTDYEWGPYKQHGNSRWCPGVKYDYTKCSCVLYPDNLPQVWADTPLKYSALEILSRNNPAVPLRYEKGFKTYTDFPRLEWIIKMGLSNLAKDLIDGCGWYDSTGKIDKKGKTIFDILGLDKLNTRVLQAANGDGEQLKILQEAQKKGIRMTAEQLNTYHAAFGYRLDILNEAGKKVTLHKLLRYIEKESARYPKSPQEGGCWRYSLQVIKDPKNQRMRNMGHDWLEYLSWCRALKYDTDQMFIYMPNNFKNVHDRVSKEYQEQQDKIAAAEKRRREREAKKRLEAMTKCLEEIFKKNENTDAFSIKGAGLILVVPKDAADIKAEGEALHHCVGTYVERVARGETNIFFIRKEAEPEKSYFTMEFRNNKVLQCRGNHNCGMPPEVEAFTKAFEKKMQDMAKKQHRKAG